MKRIVESDEVSGFDAMLGENVAIICGIYIYTGVLSGVNSDHIELSDPKIVYETGEWMKGGWKDAQSIPGPHRVMIHGIESWGPAKC